MKLVFIENNRAITDSLTVAETFGKRHDRVLQNIRELECSDEFRLHHFVESSYTNGQNKVMPKVLMTEQGFSFLAFGYTGKEAARFKEMYINEFNRLRDQLLNNVVALDERSVRMNLLKTAFDHEERIDNVERKMDEVVRKVDEQITLDSGEQRKIQKAIARKIYELESDKKIRSEYFQQLHREIHDRWAVPSYKDVRRYEFDGLLKYIEAWMPKKIA